MRYFIRHKLDRDGKLTEIKVPRNKVMKEINAMIRKDREMLRILEKL
ncbi:MAG: hypothetical protein HYW27_01455 [Candidatus Aenigmarchaeota archaeon]|nr:hypothetical protein [Candidatus Aenigmarchaeota archaeon]